MLCHNTYAFAYRLGLPNGLAGFPSDELMIAAPQVRAEIQNVRQKIQA